MNNRPFTLVGGQVLTNTHNKIKCMNEYCTLHNFSDHHMIDWPQNWRPDRKIMERICPHGIGHPDPDDITDDKTHGCDGCCALPELSKRRQTMITEPATTEQLRKELAESLVKYGMTVEEFLQTDIDDLPDWNLRDTKLMLRGVFEGDKQ